METLSGEINLSTLPPFAVVFDVVIWSRPLSARLTNGPLSSLRLGALFAGLFAAAAAACSPGYMDVAGPAPNVDAHADAVAADSAPCGLDTGCPTSPAGWALRFDGVSDCARALRPVSKDFTIEAWVLLDSLGAGTSWWEGLPIFWADLNAQANDFSATLLNGIFRFVTGSASGDAMISGKATIPVSQWIHVAITRTMSTGAMTLFVNGSVDSSGTGTTVTLAEQPDMWVFCSNTNPFTAGVIDEMRAWNVARSQAEIQSTMHERITGTEPGLVGYWRFDDGAGTSASDSSPTGNPLTLGGGTSQTAPTWVVSTAPIEGP